MNNRYVVRLLVLSDGERFPVLMGSDGQPLYEPTVYAITELRARNRATNTISNTLRDLIVLFLFLDLRRIDLEKRLSEGQILSLAEVEDLVRLSRLPVKILSQMIAETSQNEVATKKVVSFEKIRMRLSEDTQQETSPAVAATRLRSIRDYLSWLATERQSRLSSNEVLRTTLNSSKELLVSNINARLPESSGSTIGRREGLAPEHTERLLEVIDPESPANPWSDHHSRYRNELVILWLHHFGLRRGELLGIRISDIDFRKGTVVIARRADDPEDPRKNQPNVKTRAREIPISSGLLDKTSNYVMKSRFAISGAKKHDFLFVSSADGAPLSIPGIAKIFNVLRKNCSGLPDNLTPHILRHTWNDRFSEEMDRRGVSEETEKKTRSYLMGWSETSGTAANYTRRHIREKAKHALLDMQRNFVGEDEDAGGNNDL